MTQDEQKQAVAREAIKYVVDDAMIGVGSGSTANLFIDELAKIKHRIKGTVASSVKTAERLKGHGIYVDDLNNVSDIPVYIDGADEVTEHGAMIKGGGGALTREKIVAAVARKFVCIADESKLVGVLGKFPLPVEVIPMARSYVARQLVLLGRPAGVANGIHHRQRQRHSRRARPVDRQSRRDGSEDPRNRRRGHRRDSSRHAVPTSSCSAPTPACARSSHSR